MVFTSYEVHPGNDPTNGPTSAGDASSYFDIYTDSFDYYTGHGLGSWGVWYDGSGDFYLTYSVVPEPSTYVMISALSFLSVVTDPDKLFVRFYSNLKTDLSDKKKVLVKVELT